MQPAISLARSSHPTVGRRLATRGSSRWTSLLTAIAVGASGLTADFMALLALRVAAGFTGALAFVCGAGFPPSPRRAAPDRAPTLLGVYLGRRRNGLTAWALAVPPLLKRSAGAAAGSFSERSRSRHRLWLADVVSRPGALFRPAGVSARARRRASWRACSPPMVSSGQAKSLMRPHHRLSARRR